VIRVEIEQQRNNDALKRRLEVAENTMNTALEERDRVQRKYDNRCTVM
jgi:hypothetical protein